MVRCSTCGSEVSDSARFCPSCGKAVSSASQMPTAVAPRSRATSHGASSAGSESSRSWGRSLFGSGQVVAERYRIIDLIGRGGMGEVYRAEDLKLEQSVALKFLPAHLALDPEWTQRLHDEVRNSRQVSHPNVCRVYDIGEADGHSFISMEYVDGENLSTLLRRIGRLPADKANEVAQQLCAGLAAAHDKDVLHRDLKPANVMLDGDGRVRITDFGLAARIGDDHLGEVAGTPAYMAPEQFGGGTVTVRSDLYALGLVLYEVYTGKRAFEAASFADARRSHLETPATPPSQIEKALDAGVERAILRCLEKDPSRRPASARQLAASLPGGDPLAAALAAGETPSRGMVAAAGGEGATSLRSAWALLVGVVALGGAILALAPRSTDLGLHPFQKSPEVLRSQARETLARLGYTERPVDSEDWLERDGAPMKYLAGHVPSPEWRRRVRDWSAPVLYRYRQSPRWMVPHNLDGRVKADDPAHEVSGMIAVTTDPDGRLRRLRVVPPQFGPPDTTVLATDWDPLFAAAGLERSRFHAVTPQWLPPVPFDTRGEWTGPAPLAADIALRVTAAGYRGRPVFFEVLGPWSKPTRMEVERPSRVSQIAQKTVLVLVLLMLCAALAFAWSNVRLKRGDMRGALSLASFLLVLNTLSGLVGLHHVASITDEPNLVFTQIAGGLFTAALFAVMYLALEPFVRRNVPELMIGWARVLEGRLTDPRVGRDLLVGALAGSAIGLIGHLQCALPAWLRIPGETPAPPSYDALQGGRVFVSYLLNIPTFGLAPALLFTAMLFVLRLILRRWWIAVAGLWLFLAIAGLTGESVAIDIPTAALAATILTLVVVRYGILAAISMFCFAAVLQQVPLPIDLSLPYAGQSLVILLMLAAVAVYGFRISIGPRPLFVSRLDS